MRRGREWAHRGPWAFRHTHRRGERLWGVGVQEVHGGGLERVDDGEEGEDDVEVGHRAEGEDEAGEEEEGPAQHDQAARALDDAGHQQGAQHVAEAQQERALRAGGWVWARGGTMADAPPVAAAGVGRGAAHLERVVDGGPVRLGEVHGDPVEEGAGGGVEEPGQGQGHQEADQRFLRQRHPR